MNKLSHIIIVTILALLAGMPMAQAQTNDKYPDYDEDVFMEWDIEKNIATPVVEKSEKKAISKYMKALGETLSDAKYKVELMREGEVLIVSLPTDELFLPNDTLLTERGEKMMAPLLNYMKAPYMYKIVYAVNTDDTGSEQYLNSLSDARNASIYDWLMDKIDDGTISEDLVIIPYSLGATQPIATNETRVGRAQNRRVEFYFIPGPEMIEKAQKKQLKTK